MAASSESLRCSSSSFQLLNPEHFGVLPSPYTIASEDLGWIDFSVDKSDRLANAHDAFFQSIANLNEFPLAIDQPQQDEYRVLDELEELIEIIQSTQRSSASGSPSHPIHSPCKTAQTPQTAH